MPTSTLEKADENLDPVPDIPPFDMANEPVPADVSQEEQAAAQAAVSAVINQAATSTMSTETTSQTLPALLSQLQQRSDSK